METVKKVKKENFMKKVMMILMMGLSLALSAAEVDLQKSTFAWTGKKVTGEHTGFISLKSARLDASEEKITSGEFVMSIDSITVTDLKGEWAEKFLGHMKSADFFEVEKYPTAKLVITGDNGKEIMGKLTIKGKTNEIKIPYKKIGNKYSGIMTFDRTKFDMVYGSGNFFKNLGDKVISDTVTIHFNVVTK